MEFLGRKENVHPGRAVQEKSKTMKLVEKIDRDCENDSDSEPLSPFTSWLPRYNDDGDEEILDLPEELMANPGASRQVKDLERQSVKLGEHIRSTGMATAGTLTTQQLPSNDDARQDRMSQAQGELYVKSGFLFKSWRRRYGSVVEHSYFGSVLFLFKYDVDGNIEVKHSDMIALAFGDAKVSIGKNRRVNDGFRCEFTLKTNKKRYILAAKDNTSRDFWMQHL